MKIISKRQPWRFTVSIRRPGYFASVSANINGLEVYAIMLAGRWRTYAAFWSVFAERRQERNGPYVVLRSVTLN